MGQNKNFGVEIEPNVKKSSEIHPEVAEVKEPVNGCLSDMFFGDQQMLYDMREFDTLNKTAQEENSPMESFRKKGKSR